MMGMFFIVQEMLVAVGVADCEGDAVFYEGVGVLVLMRAGQRITHDESASCQHEGEGE